MQIDASAFQALFVGGMILTWLVLARFMWRRMRIVSYASIGLAAIMLDYLSRGQHFDEAYTHRAALLTALAVGLQIAWEGYKSSRTRSR